MPGSVWQASKGLGTVVCITALIVSSITMEVSMCWEIDRQLFAELKKAQETKVKQEQRASVIDRLLNNANKQGETTNVEAKPVKEVAPAK